PAKSSANEPADLGLAAGRAHLPHLPRSLYHGWNPSLAGDLGIFVYGERLSNPPHRGRDSDIAPMGGRAGRQGERDSFEREVFGTDAANYRRRPEPFGIGGGLARGGAVRSEERRVGREWECDWRVLL